MRDNLVEIVKNLIDSQKEGDYWDFKESHHGNSADFIKDVMCLANVTSYKGDRYIVFGVRDKTFEITTIEKGRKQHEIIDQLSQVPFANGRHPDVYLETIELDQKKLDILIIKDKPEKPYYLEKRYKNKEKYLNAGTIYSRIRDRNTATDSVASVSEIEAMWKERFGLDLSPLDRVSQYLKIEERWVSNGDTQVTYFKQFPEFTIDTEISQESLDCEEEWARGEIGYHQKSGNSARWWGVKYHQTLLQRVCVVNFDDNKKCIAAPDWVKFNNGRFYYYLRNSIRYAFQCYLIREYGNKDYSKGLSYCLAFGRSGTFDIPVLIDQAELDKFLEFSKENNENHSIRNNPESNEKKQNLIFYTALDKYLKYSKIRRKH